MGLCISKDPSAVKVSPETVAKKPHDPNLPDILQYDYQPKLSYVNPQNPWLSLLSPSQLVEIHSSFKKFDKDGDGHIEPKEIKRVMHDVGVKISTKEITDLIASVDKDGNGMIEFDEFVSIMASNMLRDGRGDAEIEQALRLFDHNNTGFVDLDRVRKQLSSNGSRPLAAEEVEQLLAPLTRDGEGPVSFEAFRALTCWKVPDAKVMQQHVDAAMASAAPQQ
mmetsp:Transcript_39169/g.103207  ORF Transcript_39169/g.103207 Transcript_39169/m.103207 type:complete len:222 (+) Transcript_39169:131-796(+)